MEILSIMYKYICFPLLFLLTSCSTSKNVIGNYYKKGKDFEYILSLKKDSTFILTYKGFESNPTCCGKWYNLTKNSILLKCDEEKDLAITLSSGYMLNRIHTIKIINNNKLKIGSVILNR